MENEQRSTENELILDLGPDFNQVARHEHADGKTCEMCEPKGIVSDDLPSDFARPLLKVIEDHKKNAAAKELNRDDFAAEKFQITAAELQRSFIRNGELLTRLDGERAKLLIANDTINGLRESLTDLMKDYNDCLRKLTSAEKKIAGFEQLCASLAARLDAINADLIFLTGKSYDEWLASERSLPSKESAASQADGFKEVAL